LDRWRWLICWLVAQTELSLMKDSHACHLASLHAKIRNLQAEQVYIRGLVSVCSSVCYWPALSSWIRLSCTRNSSSYPPTSSRSVPSDSDISELLHFQSDTNHLMHYCLRARPVDGNVRNSECCCPRKSRSCGSIENFRICCMVR